MPAATQLNVLYVIQQSMQDSTVYYVCFGNEIDKRVPGFHTDL